MRRYGRKIDGVHIKEGGIGKYQSGQSNRYDGNKPYPHPHLICTKCKSVVDYEVEHLNELAQQVAEKTGYQILTHRVDFFGICPDCRKKL